MSTRPTNRRTMAKALLPNFMGGGRRLTFERDDVEEERETGQREEEHDILRIDDALCERIEVRDEAEICQRIGDADGQDFFERVGEAAEAEEEQQRARAEAEHEANHLIFREGRRERA